MCQENQDLLKMYGFFVDFFFNMVLRLCPFFPYFVFILRALLNIIIIESGYFQNGNFHYVKVKYIHLA